MTWMILVKYEVFFPMCFEFHIRIVCCFYCFKKVRTKRRNKSSI